MWQRLCGALGCFILATNVTASQLNFVALGDLPYGPDTTAGAKYRALINAINRTDSQFSIHVGDFKSGSTACSDEQFLLQRRHFEQFRIPVVYTPGDNEWTDCHRKNNGGYDPLERLSKLRGLFFSPKTSLGASPMPLESQSLALPSFSAYVENQRWVREKILFLTVHIVGSNNNFETRDLKAVEEFFERDRANRAWIDSGFDLAVQEGLNAVVIAFQADVFESASVEATFPRHSGFANVVGETLLPRAKRFGRPVLLINGDTHKFRFGRPFFLNGRSLNNVYQLVVPGDQDVRAVHIGINPLAQDPFTLRLIDP